MTHHQGSSLFTTLGAALTAFSHLHFSTRNSSSLSAHKHPPTPPPPLTSFDSDLTARLHKLEKQLLNAGACLSVPWLRQAMAAVLATNSALENLLHDLHQQSLSERDRKWVDDYLDDNAKLLDVCNFLKDGVADVNHYHLQVELALHVFEAKDAFTESKCNRAKHALHDCLDAIRRKDEELFQRQQRCKLETCSSMLRRMGEKLTPLGHHSTRCNSFVSALYAAKMTTICISSFLAAALAFKSRSPFPILQIPAHFPWASSLLILQLKAKEETDRARKGSVALLRELDTVDGAVRKLHDFVEHVTVERLLPFAKEDADELLHLVGNLERSCMELEKDLGPLKQQVNEVFRMLISSRVALLDLLSHARD